MAITDIQISEELETNAPSIKYRGDEGPKSPQEMEMMADAILQEEYEKYVYDLLEQRPEATPMSLDEFRRMVIGDMSRGPVLPSDEDPINPFGPKPQGPTLPDRQMAAYGGIMGMDGRRQYGIGSFLKKTVRKLIPNEIADVAVKAAPFIAPFNPLAAALAGGLGSFDQTGSISKGLKSGLMNYGLGQASRYLGGADFQRDINPFKGPNYGFSMPTGSGGIKDLFPRKTTEVTFDSSKMSGGKNKFTDLTKEVLNPQGIDQVPSKTPLGNLTTKIMEYVPTSFSDLKDPKKILGAFGIYKGVEALANMGPEKTVSEIMERGEGLDIEGIRAEVIEAFKDSSGQKLAALRTKYPFLGTQESKDIANMAMGGRTGKAEGGIMDLGGMEKDYRNTGGFVDIGEYEKKDDVPARLSVNEFVMTADAVRGMGDGDIDLGAKRMENLMGAMENKKGAKQMFDVSERLSEVV